jgi:hypothetical protein
MVFKEISMPTYKLVPILLLAFFIISYSKPDTVFVPPYINGSNDLAPDTIWIANSGRLPDKASVTVKIDAIGSSHPIPMDIILLTDNSSSMWKRYPGDRDTITPTRIQGTYNACVNFITGSMGANDRVAHMRFAGVVDTALGFTSNLNLANAKLDTNICGWNVVKGYVISGNNVSPGGRVVEGTAVWTSVLTAVQYAMANRRPGVIPVIIALSDGDDNASGSYGVYWQPNFPNLGSTQTEAVDSIISAINEYGDSVRVFTINLGQEVNKDLMERIAQAGNGSYSYSSTGEDLDNIYQDIGHYISQAAAIELSPEYPMIVDVLPSYIEYVDGSMVETGNNTTTIDSFKIMYIGSFTELQVFINRAIYVDDTLEFMYDIMSYKAGYQNVNFGSGTFNPLYRYSTISYKDYSGQGVHIDTFSTQYLYVKADTTNIENKDAAQIFSHKKIYSVNNTTFIYNLHGSRSNANGTGIYIIKAEDGIRKVLIIK